jgi:hypothetical protein
LPPKYVDETDASGWLSVVYISGGRYPPLPRGLRVDSAEIRNGREYFTVLEGIQRGKRASVKLRADGTSYFSGQSPHRPSVNLAFDIRSGKLSGPFGTATAKTDPSNEVPRGTHTLEIPDEPHGYGRPYSTFGTTWFRIGRTGDRYLHPGRVSAGCATVTEVGKWTAIYLDLIFARVGDRRSVGRIKVT